MTLDHTHKPSLRSWVEAAQGSDFPIQNLPFGVFRGEDETARIGVAIGDSVLDVRAAIQAKALKLPRATAYALGGATLNLFMEQGQSSWRAARHAVSKLLAESSPPQEHLLVSMAGLEMLMPVKVGDYTDFCGSRHHAANVSRLMRAEGQPLDRVDLHLPIASGGRSSSVRLSGSQIRRPYGQTQVGDAAPTFGPSQELDHGVEFAAFVGPGSRQGTRIGMLQATDNLFGIAILNNWSARDIERSETQLVAPFNAKNFASTVSPWIVTIDALSPFRRPGPARLASDPPLLEHLRPVNQDMFDIFCAASLSSPIMRTANMEPQPLSRTNFTELSWSFAQMLTHHASSGCPMCPGDILGSGTVSGSAETSLGSMLEITRAGKHPITLPDGGERSFLLDGDEITITAWCDADGATRIGFGVCQGEIVPAG